MGQAQAQARATGDVPQEQRLREIADEALSAKWRKEHGAGAATDAIVALLAGGEDAAATAAAAKAVRNLALKPHNCVGSRADVVARLVELLASPSAEVQMWAAAAIGNVCAGHSDNQTAFGSVDGGMALLVGLLESPSTKVQWSALFALVNTCAGHTDNQAAFRSVEGGRALLAGLLESSSAEVQSSAAAAVGVDTSPAIAADEPILQCESPDRGLSRAAMQAVCGAAAGLLPASKPVSVDDVARVRALCALCTTVYATTKDEFEVPAGTELVHFAPSQEARPQWAVARLTESKTTAVVFRGTATAVDAAIDAAIGEHRGLHAGIAAMARRTIKDVVSHAQAALERGDAVVLTGHSLGGGYAQCTLLLAEQLRDDDRVSVVAFGAPLVRRKDGATELDDAYAGAESRMLCFVRGFDVVPRLLGGQDRGLVDLAKRMGLDGGVASAIGGHADKFRPVGEFVFLYRAPGQPQVVKARAARNDKELARVLQVSVLGGKKLIEHHRIVSYARALENLG